MTASQILATNSLVFSGGGALAFVIGKVRILHAAGRRCQVTDRNFDFQPAYKEEPLIQEWVFCNGERNWACLSTKCTSMKAKYGPISQLGRIVPVPIRVGDD